MVCNTRVTQLRKITKSFGIFDKFWRLSANIFLWNLKQKTKSCSETKWNLKLKKQLFFAKYFLEKKINFFFLQKKNFFRQKKKSWDQVRLIRHVLPIPEINHFQNRQKSFINRQKLCTNRQKVKQTLPKTKMKDLTIFMALPKFLFLTLALLAGVDSLKCYRCDGLNQVNSIF